MADSFTKSYLCKTVKGCNFIKLFKRFSSKSFSLFTHLQNRDDILPLRVVVKIKE